MPTEQDFRLEPQDGPLTKVYCRYCESEIGDVYTASHTVKGTSTGRSQEDITLDLDSLVEEHLRHCEKQPARDPGSYVNELSSQPPEKGSIRRQR